MKAVIVGAHLRAEDVEPEARALAAGEVFLSGVDVADDQPLGDRDLLLRVAKVRAALLDRATFIAVRYGFVVHGAEEAAAKVAAHAARWRALLDANRDNVEMTLKVVARNPRPRPDRRAFAGGAEYLRALHESTQAAEVDGRFRDAVSRLGTHRWIHRDGRSLECALLVPRADVPRMSEAGEALRREFPDVPFLLSGPWPLEVFAEADRQ